MLHPGLITPTHIERCMQLAYNAKYNSGCLSRQVGAVITDADYSIKGVGWNDVPKGQVPCNLRDISEYCSDKNTEEYSKFELYNNKFEKALSRICAKIKNNAEDNHDMLFQFCFKDVYNAIEGKGNQVHTRALHAEENAFLQISKYGGIGIKGGYLFTTASPCELCAKKAYQLGIKKIFYIDPYPGISKTHILDFGDKDNPEMALFEGAIGNAYLSLYAPKLPIKDELELKTGINIKSVAKNAFNERAFGEIEYELYTSNLKILNSSDYDYSIERNIKNKTNSLKDMHHEFYWDGTSVELDTKSINNDEYKVINYENNNSLISYDVEPNVPKNKNENFNYKIKFKLTDREGNIENRLSCYMKHKTRLLRMCVESFKELDNVKLCLYADKERIIMYKSFKFEDIVQEVEKNDKDNEVTFSSSSSNEMHSYCIEVKNPIMFYSYSIEWE